MSTKAHPFVAFKVASITRSAGSGTSIKLLIRHASGSDIPKTLFVPDAGGAVTDERGAPIASSVPGGLSTAISTLDTQIASLISTAEASGKFDVMPSDGRASG